MSAPGSAGSAGPASGSPPVTATDPPTGPARDIRSALLAWAVDGYRTVRHRRLSPPGFALISSLAVWALGLIIVTGGLVRLTQSGLGCPDWPTCAGNRVV
ncbi:MAG: COX15/CtaA family protein, partial [Actinomycetes bacterium]